VLPSLNFPQFDFVKPSSGFHPVTWERVTSLVATRLELGPKPSDRWFDQRGSCGCRPTQRPLFVATPARLSPRISRVFGHIDHPSTDLAVTARGSNARSAFFTSFSSTGPRTVDMQGTRFGRDIGPGKQGRCLSGHAHRTRQNRLCS